MEKSWNDHFVNVVGGLLLADAFSQFVNVVWDGQIMTFPDPILGVRHCYFALNIGVLELIVAMVCLFTNKTALKNGLIAWLTLSWAAYRTGALMEGLPWTYTCLGSFADALPGTSAVMGIAGIIVPAGLMVGAFTGLFCGTGKNAHLEMQSVKQEDLTSRATKSWYAYGTCIIGGLMLADAVVRIWNSFSASTIMVIPDPLFGVAVQFPSIVVEIAECVVALTCFYGKTTEIQCRWLFGLLVCWATYRLGIMRMGFDIRNSCFGGFLDPLGFGGWFAGLFPLIVFVFAGVGAFRLGKRQANPSEAGIPAKTFNRCTSQLGFGRTDLMFVVAGVAVLLLLAWLKFMPTGERTRSTVCGRNLAVLGQAMLSHAHDHEQCLPLARAGKPEIMWDTQLMKEMTKSRSFSDGSNSLSRAERRQQTAELAKLFVCPSDHVARQNRPRSYSLLRHDMRTIAPTVEKRELINLSLLGGPADTLMMSEIIRKENQLAEPGWADFGSLKDQLEPFQATNNSSFHLGRFNYLMMDGHVELLEPSETQNVGFYDSSWRSGIWILRPKQ